MKKLFVLCFALLAGMSTFAQVNHDIEFTDADGNIIADGSTIVRNEPHVVDDGYDVYTAILSGLYIKNMASANRFAVIEQTITRIDNGLFQCCLPICVPHAEPGTYFTNDNNPANTGTRPDAMRDIETEWLPAQYGKCDVTLKLHIYEYASGSYNKLGEGSTITINFEYNDPTGVNSTVADKKADVVSYYDLSGRQLASPAKGINIAKYSDGTTKKVIVRK